MPKNIRKITSIPKACRERYLPLEHAALAVLQEAGAFFAGLSELVPGYRIGVPEPGVGGHMVIFTLSGGGYFFTADAARHPLVSGTLLTVPAGRAVEFGVAADHWNIAWVYLRPMELWNALRAGIRCEPVSMGPAVWRAMEGCTAEAAPIGDDWAAARYAELVLHHLKKTLLTPELDEDFIRMEKLWSEVRAVPARAWLLDELAAQSGFSASTFQRRVRRFYGTTARQKLMEIRMEQARQLLEHTAFPLKVIAERVGYSDEFIFSAAFRRINGSAPGRYRRTSGKKSHS